MDLAITVFALGMALSVAAFGSTGDTIKMKNGTLRLDAQPIINSRLQGFAGSAEPRFSPTSDRVYYIIQFNGPVLPQWKKEIKSAGVQLGSYLPEYAFLAKIQSPRTWKALNKNENIRAITVFKSDLRMSHEFDSLDSNLAITSKVRLAFEAEIPNFLNVAKIRGIPFVLDGISGSILTISALKGSLVSLSDIEGVEWIEPARSYTTFDFEVALEDKKTSDVKGDYTDLTGYESGTKLMNFDGAYARGLHGEGEVVGIADTGLDRGSLSNILDDLKGQILKGYALGFFAKSWEDPQGHGTHTSGSIVGTGISSNGILHGGAYGSKLIMQGMWSPMLSNLSKLVHLDRIFVAARVKDNVHIHSDSWGSPGSFGVYDSDAAQVDEIMWRHPDLLLVFAAGNSGVDLNKDGHIDEGSVSSPATAKNCLTVGASKNLVFKGGIQKKMKELKNKDAWGTEPIASTTLSDNPNGMAPFSSIGPTTDGRIKPDIVAPGTNIISTRSLSPDASELWGKYNDIYVFAGGTSMATPLAAGAASVVRQYLREIGFSNPSAALMKAVLLHGATDLFPGQFGLGPQQEFRTTRPNVNEGYGRVNVDASTQIAKNLLIDDDLGLQTGETKVFKVNVKAGQVARTTMVYTDAPASEGTAQALVNDLDLKVTDDRGHVYFPNHHKRTPDEDNNTEMIEFTPDHDEAIMVSVYGRNVPKGKEISEAQPYALVLP